MPLIVVNDLLFIWGSVGSLSINSCNVGMLEGEISWTGGGFFGGGGGCGGKGLVLCGVQSLCLLWMVWKECNCRAFEGFERSLVDLKLFLLHILHKWMAGSNQLPFTLLDFIDSCSLS